MYNAYDKYTKWKTEISLIKDLSKSVSVGFILKGVKVMDYIYLKHFVTALFLFSTWASL